jgi:hypothetical protein
MIALAMSNERADAYNSVVDVLRKLVAEDRTNVSVSKRKDWRYVSGRSADWRTAPPSPTPDMILGCRRQVQSGYGPNDLLAS